VTGNPIAQRNVAAYRAACFIPRRRRRAHIFGAIASLPDRENPAGCIPPSPAGWETD